MSDRVDINRVLLEMRTIRNQAAAFNGVGSLAEGRLRETDPMKAPNGPQFGEILAQAVDKVNSIQQQSGSTAKAYVKGDPGVDITDVMIASQQSSVAFQAMTQVRNKVVEAYKDVMNMPI